MNKIMAISKDIERMTVNQLRVAKVNYTQELKRLERKYLILSATIDDKKHPDILQAEYQYLEAKDIIRLIEVAIKEKRGLYNARLY